MVDVLVFWYVEVLVCWCAGVFEREKMKVIAGRRSEKKSESYGISFLSIHSVAVNSRQFSRYKLCCMGRFWYQRHVSHSSAK